jgi:hypothetical protein
MAVYMNGQETYKGAVIGENEHMWMDGMLEVFAVVWDMDNHELKHVQTGYFGSDGHNMNEATWSKVDLTSEVLRDMLRTWKQAGLADFARSVTEYKNTVRKGQRCEVVKGRKVKKGTQLEVFWVGERETYKSRQYSWMHETETVAGCYDENGEKVWIKAEYLHPMDAPKSPSANERRKYVRAYVLKQAQNVLGYDKAKKIERGRVRW